MLNVDKALIREHFPITVQRTHAELQGHRLIHPWDDGTEKQAISCGRSFGRPVTTLHELTEAAAEFADRATTKLRAQGSVTSVIQVYARSNPFSAHVTPYSRSRTIKLIRPTDDTREITRVVALALASIFNERVAFTKAGVVLLELDAKHRMQTDLFSAFSLNQKAEAVMSVYDAINKKFGRRSVRLGRSTGKKNWAAKAEHMSMRATSDWQSIPPCY
ncbi:DinB/UmuC family translesion DNA polymerase [Pseudomonas frederiksbergensis]